MQRQQFIDAALWLRRQAPFFIAQNGEASMVIESVKQFQEKESLIAALKLIALGRSEAGAWCRRRRSIADRP